MLPGNTKTARALRALALRNPGAEEGIACKGTKLECATFGVGKQTFLFVGLDAAGSYTLRLKLADSLDAAAEAARRDPQAIQVGAGGWVKLTFAEGTEPPRQLGRWIEESFRCVTAGKGTKKKAGAKRR